MELPITPNVKVLGMKESKRTEDWSSVKRKRPDKKRNYANKIPATPAAPSDMRGAMFGYFITYPENTNHRGSITVMLTSCLTCLDFTKQGKLLFVLHKQSSRIQTKIMRSAIQSCFPLRSKLVCSERILWTSELLFLC